MSRAMRERVDAPWDALEHAVRTARAADPDEQVKELWTAIRTVVRPLAAALGELVGDDPAAAFALDPVPRRAGPAKAAGKRRRA